MSTRPESSSGAAASKTAPASKVSDIFSARLGELEGRIGRELGRPAAAAGPAGEFLLDVAREGWRIGSQLFDSVVTGAGRREVLASWTASSPIDELGLDLALTETVRELVKPLARRWLAVNESRGASLPDRGGVLLLFNQSAWPIPVEALVLSAFLGDGRLGGRRLVALVDPGLPELPYVSDLLRRIGVVAATPDNAFALLERGAVVVAFPEGEAAATKTYDRRYRLARFEGRGLIGAALEAGARIVPAALVGSEESFPVLGHFAGLPVTAQFPLLGPLGLLPLPLTWTIRLGAAVEHADAADLDDARVEAIADAVRARMQALLGELLGERSSAVGG